MKSFFRIKQVVNLFICLIVVSSLAITKHHELFGYSLKSEQKAETASNDTLRMFGNGRAEINTSVLASNIMGYGGKVPLKIVIRNGVVENIIALKNDETKEFFDNASTLFEKWKGKTIDKAMDMKVDAVTGATFSSKAIIGNMHQGLLYAKAHLATEDSENGSSSLSPSENNSSSLFSLRNIIGIAVVLMAAILPLFIKNRRYHFCQLILNVIVLGLVWYLPFLYLPAGLCSPWHGNFGQHHSDSHAGNSLYLSAFWKEVALLYPCMSVWLPATDSWQMREIQVKNETRYYKTA